VSDFGALPNLHPALVHFPLALLPTAWLLELAGWLRPRQAWFERAAVALYFGAAVGAGAAYLAGESAEDGLMRIPATAQAALAAHADAALKALVAVVLIALVRLALAIREARQGRAVAAASRAVGLVGGALGIALLAVTADRGGALVYRQALGVVLPALVREPPAAMPALDPKVLDIDGELWLPLDLELGDGTLEIDLEVSEYAGVVSLFHHRLDENNYGAFEVAWSGAVRLLARRAGGENVLDRGATQGLPDRVRLAVSVAGHHLKGLINGRAVVHGHADPGPGRGVGVRFAGRGRVALHGTGVMVAGPVAPAR